MLLFPNGLYSAAAAPAGWSGPSTGLTHRWPMDDANVSGATVSDVVGTINGTSTSTTDITSGLSGAARHFDRVGWINLGSSPLTVANSHTVAFWVNFDDITNDGYQPTPVNFVNAAGDTGLRFLFDPTGGPDVAVAVMIVNGGTDLNSVSLSLSGGIPGMVGTLNHWAFTYDSSTGNSELYRNGVITSPNKHWAGGYGTSPGYDFGAKDPAAPYGRISAFMKNVVVYNRALSGSEITTLYSAG